MHVESVAWVAERKDVLSILFGLLSILAYVGYAKSGHWPYWTASLLLFVCSLMTKQTLVTIPFLLLLLDYWPLERLRISNREQKSLDVAPRPRTQSAASCWKRFRSWLSGRLFP